ncbi:MAG: hypothetical protein WC730_00930 [Patescibacteria group bacterium]|jgi:hypothetical protein
MKKIIATSIATVLPIFAGVTPTFAQTPLGDGWLSDVQGNSGLSNMDLPSFIGQIIYTLLSFLGIVFLAFTIYAGFLWMTAGGEAEKTKKAQTLLMNAVIGLIIILAAYAITNFVMTQIGLSVDAS